MALMPPVRLLRSATKVRRNSIGNTAASSSSLLCETFERFFLRGRRNSNWPVVSELRDHRLRPKAQAALRLLELAHTSCGVLGEWSAIRKLSRNGLPQD